jgi:hypothetical protein
MVAYQGGNTSSSGAGGAGPSGAGGGDSSSGSSQGGSTGAGNLGGGDDVEQTSGCGCQLPGRARFDARAGWLALLGLGLMRRRARARFTSKLP